MFESADLIYAYTRLFARSGETGCPQSSGQRAEKTATRSVRTCY
jgi:hypothetical protein